jgi:hypothetical protein
MRGVPRRRGGGREGERERAREDAACGEWRCIPRRERGVGRVPARGRPRTPHLSGIKPGTPAVPRTPAPPPDSSPTSLATQEPPVLPVQERGGRGAGPGISFRAGPDGLNRARPPQQVPAWRTRATEQSGPTHLPARPPVGIRSPLFSSTSRPLSHSSGRARQTSLRPNGSVCHGSMCVATTPTTQCLNDMCGRFTAIAWPVWRPHKDSSGGEVWPEFRPKRPHMSIGARAASAICVEWAQVKDSLCPSFTRSLAHPLTNSTHSLPLFFAPPSLQPFL